MSSDRNEWLRDGVEPLDEDSRKYPAHQMAALRIFFRVLVQRLYESWLQGQKHLKNLKNYVDGEEAKAEYKRHIGQHSMRKEAIIALILAACRKCSPGGGPRRGYVPHSGQICYPFPLNAVQKRLIIELMVDNTTGMKKHDIMLARLALADVEVVRSMSYIGVYDENKTTRAVKKVVFVSPLAEWVYDRDSLRQHLLLHSNIFVRRHDDVDYGDDEGTGIGSTDLSAGTNDVADEDGAAGRALWQPCGLQGELAEGIVLTRRSAINREVLDARGVCAADVAMAYPPEDGVSAGHFMLKLLREGRLILYPCTRQNQPNAQSHALIEIIKQEPSEEDDAVLLELVRQRQRSVLHTGGTLLVCPGFDYWWRLKWSRSEQSEQKLRIVGAKVFKSVAEKNKREPPWDTMAAIMKERAAGTKHGARIQQAIRRSLDAATK